MVRSNEEGKLNIKKSYVAILWTCLIVITLVSFSVSSLANAPTRESTTENWTTHIVNYLTYGSSALFFLYLALRSPKLAAILRSLVRSKAEIKRSLVGRSDFIHGMCFLGVVAGVTFFTYCSVRDFTARLRDGSESLFYHIPVTMLDPAIEFTSITLGLLVYYILKVVGLEVMDVVMATSALGQQPRHSIRTPVSSGQRHAKVLPKVSSRRRVCDSGVLITVYRLFLSSLSLPLISYLIPSSLSTSFPLLSPSISTSLLLFAPLPLSLSLSTSLHPL